MRRTRVVIMGAAGRDFHNFNVFFRNASQYQVVAFTATQIPHITGRVYPRELAGRLYPKGIRIRGEEELDRIIRADKVDLVVFSYSDVTHVTVMHKASQAMAAGADFMLLGPASTYIESRRKVIAVCATRTGSGKSQTTRRVCDMLEAAGTRVAVIRHPMPYGDLKKQAVQRFATEADLDFHRCTIEEREEYEPHIDQGRVVYAGVDYGAILRAAEKEADVIVWDGGNNDLPFYRPDLHIVVVDPHRVGDQATTHPGEANLRMADVVVINKMDTARRQDVVAIERVIESLNPKARVIRAASPISVDRPDLIRGKRVLVIEDGPTLTHGDMSFGAGIVAAKKYGARKCIDPRPFAVGELKATLKKYPRLVNLIPAMGYTDGQLRDLETSIRRSRCDAVVNATPADLSSIIDIKAPVARVTYALKEIGSPNLRTVLKGFLGRRR
ncbi:MAG: cyclic 2,3-diphosphoglycerate synthase [bacterium]